MGEVHVSTALALPQSDVALPRQRTLTVVPTSVPASKLLADRMGALVLLVLLIPVFFLLALAVATSGRGGILFRQERVGLHGRTFVMLKFRTMHPQAHLQRRLLLSQDQGNGVLFKIRRDPRTTAIGRVLRRWSLDELPQLLNVVRGEMALVGPRPALPEEVARYSTLARRRLDVKPGVTGLWQVSGRSNLSWEDSVMLDLHYVERASLAFDARILLRTVTAVASGRGAY
jgi:lipopolysaccharide/colanic/teichoic acid biosynthesis glycosyltransferase